jgi:hypothetical protein
MRLIKTYLLRLYADTDASERICGDVRPLDEKRSYSFKNLNDFIVLMRQLAGIPSHSILPQKRTDSPEKGDT